MRLLGVAHMRQAYFLKVGVEQRDELLSNREREHELGSNHQDLWQQSLEERSKPFVPNHLLDDVHATLWVVKVAVLDPCLDDVQGRRHRDRGDGPTNRGAKVLEKGGFVVVLELEDPFLDKC